MCLKGTSVSGGDDKPSSTCSEAVNLRNDSADVWRSVRGGISIISCYGRQMTLWEEQWAASSLFDCQINKVAMNFMSTRQSAWRWQGRPLRGAGRGAVGAGGGCRGLIKLRRLHGNISNILPPPEVPECSDKKKKKGVFLCSGWLLFSCASFHAEVRSRTLDGRESGMDDAMNQTPKDTFFYRDVFSAISARAWILAQVGFSKKKKNEAKRQKQHLWQTLQHVCVFRRPSVSTKRWESNTNPQSQLRPSHFVTMWNPKPVKRR